jgi:SPP1 family predicted phage head-tail adaptor
VSEARHPISSLTDRLAYQRRDTSLESAGGQAVAYVPVATLWGRVRGLSVRQGASADARAALASHSVVVRFRADVRPGDRFVHRGRNLYVLGAEDIDGGRAFLACRCTETAVTA